MELHPTSHRGFGRCVERVVEPGDERRGRILQPSVRVDVVSIDARDPWGGPDLASSRHPRDPWI